MTDETTSHDHGTQAGLGPDAQTDFHDPPETPPSWAWSETEPEPIWEPEHPRRVVGPLLGVLLAAVAVPVAILLAGHQESRPEPNTSPATTTLAPAAPSPVTSDPPSPSPEPRPSYDAGPPAQHMVPPPPPSLDAQYLALLATNGWNVTDPQAAETAGHLACTGLSASHNLLTTENWLQTNYGILPAQAHAVTIAASVVYCPDTPGG